MRFGILILAVIVICGFIFWKDIRSVGVKGINTISNKESSLQSDVEVLEEWKLPSDLREISGIAYLDAQRFAAVQDEKGTIYIYNIVDKKIEREVEFGPAGDYEDIAIVGDRAWVVRADGHLFEVSYKNDKPAVKEHKTSLTIDHNVEGLGYDAGENRLLLAIKDEEPGSADYKGIYSFDLSNNKFNPNPVITIDLADPLLNSEGENKKDGQKEKKKKVIKPSAIAVHPVTKEIYISDGPKSMLAIMSRDGKIQKWLSLGKNFNQPEGLAFDPQGNLYVSNEGGKGDGNLLRVTLP